ncbi:hypothetical protein GGR21_002527 [Dysgonomonas hofstadii]|uniref:AAA+ ATPase domain-containing protein n=1 Tax=Dysgonomonas hofstadii TaxID=637886 RepID=A0A840CND9_9BACT|nr:ATP-binding protein [Dysgonomonas hofstadii]MBB4036621.1 hypothetical protein [Dysgonomonas hofstadii]
MIDFLRQIIQISFSLYFKEGNRIKKIPSFKNEWFQSFIPQKQAITFEEQVILSLALMPHLSSETLDIFFFKNKDYDRYYTEFGGCQGSLHGGFLPTGQTAAFLLTQLAKIRKELESSIYYLFSKEHWFYKENILRLEGQGEGEPFLSGRLVVSGEVLAKVLFQTSYEPEYNSQFPAKRITSPLEWNDLVLPWHLHEELNDINQWLQHQSEIRKSWNLNRIIKPGYRCLFYGPPGTGKTLTAALLGKQNSMDVYRIDLSMIVSKYIGETEKNLAKVFDKAEHQKWILFFDEADALFGQRTETKSSNDRHANQEVAYLLQRIEDHSGTIILASNLKENIDNAFFRRFQSIIHFPMPDQHLRYELWEKMIPAEWLSDVKGNILQVASRYTLSGGSIVNVIQQCAIKLYNSDNKYLDADILKASIKREIQKEGRIIDIER